MLHEKGRAIIVVRKELHPEMLSLKGMHVNGWYWVHHITLDANPLKHDAAQIPKHVPQSGDTYELLHQAQPYDVSVHLQCTKRGAFCQAREPSRGMREVHDIKDITLGYRD